VVSSSEVRGARARRRPSSETAGKARNVPLRSPQRPGARVAGTLRVAGTQVSDVQRTRMLRAGMEVVGALGYGGMSVARVTARAGVSRRTFYELFEGRDDCFLAVFEESVARATAIAGDAAGGGSWRERIRAGLAAVLLFFGEDPVMGSLLVLDALAAGSPVLERRARLLESLAAVVDGGRSEPGAAEAPPLSAEGVVGAVLSVVHARMLDRDRRPLIELLNPLMGMIVLPYLGHAAAEEELRRPLPRMPRKRSKVVGDPLDGLGMRLTYRTLRVLGAIAADPGASNRRVADGAGVQDQGQISKLLTRLEALGLIANSGHGQAKGEPNAWSLTAKGKEVAYSVEADTQT
jgi:AcrR family transcriptional regulator/DNA-binding MarR family transcriptional regulator